MRTGCLAGRVNRETISVREIARQDQASQRVLDLALDEPLQRTSTVDRIIAVAGQLLTGLLGDLDRDTTLREPLAQATDLDLRDPRQVLLRKTVGR